MTEHLPNTSFFNLNVSKENTIKIQYTTERELSQKIMSHIYNDIVVNNATLEQYQKLNAGSAGEFYDMISECFVVIDSYLNKATNPRCNFLNMSDVWSVEEKDKKIEEKDKIIEEKDKQIEKIESEVKNIKKRLGQINKILCDKLGMCEKCQVRDRYETIDSSTFYLQCFQCLDPEIQDKIMAEGKENVLQHQKYDEQICILM